MLVMMNSCLQTPEYHCLPGKVVNLPDEFANTLIEKGYAIEFKGTTDQVKRYLMPERKIDTAAIQHSGKIAGLPPTPPPPGTGTREEQEDEGDAPAERRLLKKSKK